MPGSRPMFGALRQLLWVALCCGAGSGWGGASGVSAVALEEAQASRAMGTDTLTWLAPSAQTGIAVVAGAPGDFQATPADTVHALTPDNALWIKLRVQRNGTGAWTLNVPLPDLDAVTLYQADGAGGWLAQRAGDTLARAQWSKNGLYPEFDLHIADAKPHELYLQIRNSRAISVPLWLASTPERDFLRLLEALGLGLLLGVTLLITTLSATRYGQHRSAPDALAALYGLLVGLALAQVNGVLNAIVWADSPRWADVAFGVIPMVAWGCGLLLSRQLFALAGRYPRYDQFLIGVGGLSIASALNFVWFDRLTADAIAAGIWLLANTAVMIAAVLSWRSGAKAGRWLTIAFFPQYLGALWLALEFLGWVSPWWPMRYLMTVCITLNVPLLAYALSRVTHDRKELEVRADQLPTQDALTGLLTPTSFMPLLEDAYERAVSQREPVALALLRVVNHEHIRQLHGDTTAEQCLLRAVVKLQRVLRDVDPAGRVGNADFAVLMEGVSDGPVVSERLVRLIASGLIPLPGLYPEVTLQFQVACVLLHRNPVPPERALLELEEILASMSVRTRRPIRFLDAMATMPAMPDGDVSSLMPPHTD